MKYGFYIVDGNGNPVNEQGQITSFEQSQKPHVSGYEPINGYHTEHNAIDAFEESGLSDLYILYNPNASFEIDYYDEIDGKSYNYWTNNDDGETKTTYVKSSVDSEYTKDGTNLDPSKPNAPMDKTEVYYAVRKKCASADVVVIDYGVPVKINVLFNDVLTAGSQVIGVNKSGTVPADLSDPTGFGTTANDTFGSISLDGNQVVYSINTMSMNDADVFTYVAKDKDSGYHFYSTVTVIPATQIYYDDSFVSNLGLKFDAFDFVEGTTDQDQRNTSVKWEVQNPTVTEQDEDRPGESASASIDADSLYGYDSEHTNMQTYSMGSYHKFTSFQKKVGGKNVVTYGTVEFTFTGTGFDVISLTSNKTGMITVGVYDAALYASNKPANKPIPSTVPLERAYMVDTYYGYTYSNGK
jgi:hypothetical protein